METRPLTTQSEYEACVELQRLTWGDDFRELVSPAMLKVAQQVGGICAGTYDGGQLIGFVYGLTGLLEGEPVHWSHMLAVRADYQNRGLGRKLKEFQRRQLVASGIQRMLWTFDPLVARNAHLNLNRLGARVREYVPDMYGENPISATDSVIGTDRFIVEWQLAQPHAVATPSVPDGAPIVTAAELAVPVMGSDFPTGTTVLIEIPDDVQSLKINAPEEARAFRRTVRGAMQHYLTRGYVVAGLARDLRMGRAFYVLAAV